MSSNNTSISWSRPNLSVRESKLALQAIDSTWVSGGDFVIQFENLLRQHLRVKHVISVNNGTSALMLALLASGVKANDTIIVPAFGFMAAANIALMLNLKVVFADVYEDTWNINLKSVSEQDLNQAKAVIGIDTYGNPCDVKEMNMLAKEFGWIVIQDCAESFGSKIDKFSTGTQVDIGTFSFHATKLITTGEGGAFVTNNSELAMQAELYRSHGMDRQIDYLHKVPGNNLRLSNILAAIGVAQISKIQEFIESRKKIDLLYRELLSEKNDFSLQTLSSTESVPWSFPIILNRGRAFRDQIQSKLKRMGIETRTGFKSPKYLSYFERAPEYKIADFLSDNILSLPAYPGLTTSQIKYISNSLVMCVNDRN